MCDRIEREIKSRPQIWPRLQFYRKIWTNILSIYVKLYYKNSNLSTKERKYHLSIFKCARTRSLFFFSEVNNGVVQRREQTIVLGWAGLWYPEYFEREAQKNRTLVCIPPRINKTQPTKYVHRRDAARRGGFVRSGTPCTDLVYVMYAFASDIAYIC